MCVCVCVCACACVCDSIMCHCLFLWHWFRLSASGSLYLHGSLQLSLLSLSSCQSLFMCHSLSDCLTPLCFCLTWSCCTCLPLSLSEKLPSDCITLSLCDIYSVTFRFSVCLLPSVAVFPLCLRLDPPPLSLDPICPFTTPLVPQPSA